MNLITYQTAEYAATVLAFTAAGLFIAAAVGVLTSISAKRILPKSRAIVTLIRIAYDNADASHLLSSADGLLSRRRDQVLVCGPKVDKRYVKILRANISSDYSRVYAPKKTTMLNTVLRLAYGRSKRGDIIMILPARQNVSDAFITRAVGCLKKGIFIRIGTVRTEGLSVNSLVETYASLVRRVCRDASKIQRKRRRLEVGAIYWRGDFLAMDQRLGVAWMNESTAQLTDQAQSQGRGNVLYSSFSVVYAVVAIMIGLVSVTSHHANLFGLFWVGTMAWLILAAIIYPVQTDKIAMFLSLPLAPVVLLANMLVYPLARVAKVSGNTRSRVW